MRLLLSSVLALIGVAQAAAQDWPRFRGPNGSGISDCAVPASWTEKDYRWRAKLPGTGHSSPVVRGERLFVTAADAAGKLHVLCLDTATGKQRWSRALAAARPRGHKDNSLAAATPAVDERHVYVAWGGPKETVLLALTLDGTEVWRRDLGPYRAGHGFAASPIVDDGRVVLPCEQDGTDCLVAVAATTGQELWRRPRKSRNTYATPCLFQPAGRKAELIAVSYEDGVTSLDPATGRPNWTVDAFDKRHIEGAIASPFVHGELILASAGWLGVRYETLALRPDEARVETIYRIQRGAPLVPTPLAKDDLLFLWGDGGIVTCVDARTGARHWSERVDGTFYASPVCAAGQLLCPSREGELFVLAASKRFEQIARIPLGEASYATPALGGGRLFLRTASQVLCLDGTPAPRPPR